MPIGIMSAMREEIEALIQEISVRDRIVRGMRTYYVGQLWNKEVVLVFSRWGKVASATTATHLVTDFNVSEILFTGVAGAIVPDLNIGDVVIGDAMYQHDMDASPILPRFEVPLLGKKSFNTDAPRNQVLSSAVQSFIQSLDAHFKTQELEFFGIENPKFLVGAMASGDQFISDKSQYTEIADNLQDVLCVEMEGAAVAQVCFEYKIPFNIIRTISDKADDNAHIDFPRFAAEVASRYARGIIQNYFSSLPDETP